MKVYLDFLWHDYDGKPVWALFDNPDCEGHAYIMDSPYDLCAWAEDRGMTVIHSEMSELVSFLENYERKTA